VGIWNYAYFSNYCFFQASYKLLLWGNTSNIWQHLTQIASEALGVGKPQHFCHVTFTECPLGLLCQKPRPKIDGLESLSMSLPRPHVLVWMLATSERNTACPLEKFDHIKRAFYAPPCSIIAGAVSPLFFEGLFALSFFQLGSRMWTSISRC
jgi:hypothetical protein